MSEELDPQQVAEALILSMRLFVRQFRQPHPDDVLTAPETSALSRLDRGGPATSSALAKLEQISPQSMGATLAGLEARGLIERRSDPGDGRRVVLSVTDEGLAILQVRRSARTARVAEAISRGEFTTAELRQLLAVGPLLERLAQSF